MLCRVENGFITFVSVYALDEERKQESEELQYCILQRTLDGINRNDYIMAGGDLKARVGSIPMERILGQYNESVCNVN